MVQSAACEKGKRTTAKEGLEDSARLPETGVDAPLLPLLLCVVVGDATTIELCL